MKTFRRKLYKYKKGEFGPPSEVIKKERVESDKPVIHSEALEETLKDLLQTKAFQFNS